jgi:hypothetical protein
MLKVPSGIPQTCHGVIVEGVTMKTEDKDRVKYPEPRFSMNILYTGGRNYVSMLPEVYATLKQWEDRSRMPKLDLVTVFSSSEFRGATQVRITVVAAGLAGTGPKLFEQVQRVLGEQERAEALQDEQDAREAAGVFTGGSPGGIPGVGPGGSAPPPRSRPSA